MDGMHGFKAIAALGNQTLFRPAVFLLAGVVLLVVSLIHCLRHRGESRTFWEKAELLADLILAGLWTLFALLGFLGSLWGIEPFGAAFQPGTQSGNLLYDFLWFDGEILVALLVVFILFLRGTLRKKRENGAVSRWDWMKTAVTGLFASLFFLAASIRLVNGLTGSRFLENFWPGMELGVILAAGLFIWISSLVRLLYARRRGEEAPLHLYVVGIGPLVLLGFILLMAGFVWLPRLLEPGAGSGM